jgi:hypothetical protein
VRTRVLLRSLFFGEFEKKRKHFFEIQMKGYILAAKKGKNELKALFTEFYRQGDQIGRIFAYWAIV